jgi:hypothetical protein
MTEQTRGSRLLFVRLALLLVGAAYIGAALAGAIEASIWRLLGGALGAALVVVAAQLGRHRWAYYAAVAVVSGGVVVDLATRRVPGLALYGLLLMALLTRVNRQRWMRPESGTDPTA